MSPISTVSDMCRENYFNFRAIWFCKKVDLCNNSSRVSSLAQFFHPMGGGHQILEAGRPKSMKKGDQKKDRDEIWHACYWHGGRTTCHLMSLHREKSFWHPNGAGVTANDNVTCMLKKELPCTSANSEGARKGRAAGGTSRRGRVYTMMGVSWQMFMIYVCKVLLFWC